MLAIKKINILEFVVKAHLISDLALWLLEQNIGSMSLNPDTVIETWLMLAKINEN